MALRAQEDGMEEAVCALREGRPVAFPTDTVYGVGVAVEYAAGPQELFCLKRRDEGKPVAWLVGSPDDLLTYGEDVSAYAIRAARAFWPGALTLIVRAGECVPAAFRSSEGTIGLRMPAGAAALELIRKVGCPLATTSANFSGEPATGVFDELDPAFAQAVGVVVRESAASEGGECGEGEPAPHREGESAPAAAERNMRCEGNDAVSAMRRGGSGMASTVLDCTGPEPVMLREGDVTLADILQLL